MQAQRKPKKLVIQVLIAAVIAIVVGVCAIGLVMMVITSVTTAAGDAQKKAQAELEANKAELERLKAAQTKPTILAPVKVKQVQALMDISAGEPITQALVGVVELEGKAADGSYAQVSDVLGKVAKVSIVSGEPLTNVKLLDSGNLLQVKPGMRAVTLGLDKIASLDGALLPGSFVDVLMTVSADGSASSSAGASSGSGMIKTLLQNIQVISAGGNAGGTSSSSGGITFLVTPTQAELLVLAGQKTKLTLALRNFKDKSRPKVSGADMDRLITDSLPGIAGRVKNPKAPKSLLNGSSPFNNQNVPVTYTPQALPEPSAPAVQAAPKYSMKIYAGSGSQTVAFD